MQHNAATAAAGAAEIKSLSATHAAVTDAATAYLHYHAAAVRGICYHYSSNAIVSNKQTNAQYAFRQRVQTSSPQNCSHCVTTY